MSHQRWEIWEEPASPNPEVPWRAKMVNYVGGFKTKDAAERFVAAAKEYREKHGMKQE